MSRSLMRTSSLTRVLGRAGAPGPAGGLIMVDNTFSHGRVLDAGNYNPSVIAVRTMNDLAAADDRVELVMVPIGDGLTVALRH